MRDIKKFLQKLRPVQLIVLFYLLAVVVSVILLSLPFVTKPGVKWTFIDALFTSVSAVSVTYCLLLRFQIHLLRQELLF